MRKTKVEIIELVIERVLLIGRSTNEVGAPMYMGDRGNKCGVGMFIDPSKFYTKYENKRIEAVEKTFDIKLDDILLEEARGHDIHFWRRIQSLHDDQINWEFSNDTPSGLILSTYGKTSVDKFKQECKEEQASL